MTGNETILQYLTNVPAWYLATSVNDQPHVRPFSFAAEQDGKIWFVTATTKDVYLVSLDDEHIESLCATSDYYTKNVIPADVYGTDGDVTTVAVGAVILARDDVSEDAIYNFTKDLFDNAEAEVSSHAKYGELNLDFAASVTSVPYHPGAAKYFAEKGYMVPTK